MSTLLRFVWRELLRSRGRAALIVLILTVQTAALGGGFIAEDSLFHTRDVYYARLHLADLDVRFVAAADGEMPSLDALRAIPGVAAVSRRFVAAGQVERPSGATMPVVVHYLDPDVHPEVNDLELRSGTFLSSAKPEEALVDRSFADCHGLAIGDELVVNPRRFATRLRISGTALSPEYLVPTANPELLVPHKGSLGIIYASRGALDRMFTDRLYNNLLFTFRDDADPRVVTPAILDALASLDVERVVNKRSNFSYRFLDEMLGGSRVVMPTIAVLLAIMAAVVAFLSVQRLIAERRREIGCLLAHGFSPWQLVTSFLALGLAAGLAAALLGVPAAIAFATLLTHTNADITGFPLPMMLFPASKLAFAATSAVAAGAISAFVPALGILRLRPSHALRGADEIGFTGLPRVVERLLEGWPSLRHALRSVSRRLRLSAATVALVALAVAMPAALLTSLSSWNTFATDQTKRLAWDAIATFKVPLEDEHVAEIMTEKGAGDFEGYVQGYATMYRDGQRAEEMRVRGMPVPSALVDLCIVSGKGFSGVDADEAILNAAFTHGQPPVLGETISVVARGVRHRLRVVGLVTDASLSTMFVPRGTAQRMFALQGKLSGAYLSFAAPTHPVAALHPRLAAPGPRPEGVEKIDLEDGVTTSTPAPMPIPAPAAQRPTTDVKSALLDDELVTTVQIKTEYAGATMRYLASFNTIIVPFVGLGALLAFLFLLSVLGFLLLDRESEYATLRTMGYDQWRIAKLVLAEVATLGVLGLGCSVGVWALVTYALRDPMAKAWFAVPVDFRLHDFAAVAVPTALLLLVAALPGIRRLMQLDLATVLRGRGMG